MAYTHRIRCAHGQIELSVRLTDLNAEAPLSLDSPRRGQLDGPAPLFKQVDYEWPPPADVVDLTGMIATLRYQIGARDPHGVLTRFEAGSLTLTVAGADPRLNPGEHVTWVYRHDGFRDRGGIRPGSRIEVTARHNNQTVPLFTGAISDYTYQEESETVTINATDAATILAANDRRAVSEAGRGETASARITRILTAAGWPTDRIDISPGGPTLSATSMAGPVWTELCRIADSDPGCELYASPAGNIVYRPESLVAARRKTATPIMMKDLPAGTVEQLFTLDQIVNVAKAAVHNADGTTFDVTTSDQDSERKFGSRTYNRTDLFLPTEAAAQAWGQRIITSCRELDYQLATVTLDAGAFPSLVDLFIRLEIGQLWNPIYFAAGNYSALELAGWAAELNAHGAFTTKLVLR